MTHRIFPGSLEQEGSTIRAGVHTGDHDFSTHGLRYIQGDIRTGQPSESVIEFLGRIYDGSTGCLMKRDFALNEG